MTTSGGPTPDQPIASEYARFRSVGRSPAFNCASTSSSPCSLGHTTALPFGGFVKPTSISSFFQTNGSMESPHTRTNDTGRMFPGGNLMVSGA